MALQKREKKMLIGLGVVAVLGGLMLFRTLRGGSDDDKFNSPSTKTAPTAVAQTSSPRGGGGGGGRSGGGGGRSGGGGGRSGGGSSSPGISYEEFEKHASVGDCWVIIAGEVYDISNYNKSSGSAGITLQYCGTAGFDVGYIQGDQGLAQEIIAGSVNKGVIR